MSADRVASPGDQRVGSGTGRFHSLVSSLDGVGVFKLNPPGGRARHASPDPHPPDVLSKDFKFEVCHV